MTQPKITLGSVGPNVKAVLKTDQGKVLEAKLSVGLPGKGGVVQYQANGVDVGTPAVIRALNFTGDGVSGSASGEVADIAFMYSGQFRGTWDMSSGSSGPAVPATDYQSTHTSTTVTPDATLTYGGPSFWPSTATSNRIPVTTGSQSASVTRSNYVSGDTVSFEYVMLANSSASPYTFSDILQGVALTVPTYFVLVGFSRASGLMIAYAMNNDSPTMIALSASSVGDVASIDFDGATATIKLNGTTKGAFTPAIGSFPAGDDLRLYGGTLSTAASVVFSAGHVNVNFSDTDIVTSVQWDSARSHINGSLTNPTRTALFAAGAIMYQNAFALPKLSAGKTTMSVLLGDWTPVDYTSLGVVWLNDAGQYAGFNATLAADKGSLFEHWITLAGGDGGGISGFADSGRGPSGLRVFVDIDSGHWGAVAGNGAVFSAPTILTPGSPGQFYTQLYPYYGGSPSTGAVTVEPTGYGAYASVCVQSGGGSGFVSTRDADLPAGALDNDWYEVSAGGYFHGKTTRAGQFVKLIRGKTDLIVVPKPADPGTSAVESVTVTHFSDINTTGVTDPRLYVVTADETNANQRTQYLYDGSAMMWLVALEA